MDRRKPVGRHFRQPENAFLTPLALRVKKLDAEAASGGSAAKQEIGASLGERREVDCHIARLPDVRHSRAVEDEQLDPIAVVEVALDDRTRRITIGGVDWQQHDGLRNVYGPLGLWSSWPNLSLHHRS